MKRAVAPAALPLLTWPEASEAARMRLERQALLGRIMALPKMSHRRVVLQHRLAMITAELLALETRLKRLP